MHQSLCTRRAKTALAATITTLVTATAVTSTCLPSSAVVNSAPNQTAAVESVDDMTFTESPVVKQAVALLSDNKNADAKQLLVEATKNKNGNAVESDVYYLLALAEYNDAEYKSAAADLQKVLELSAKRAAADPQYKAWLLKRIGDCYFSAHDTAQALANYQSALADAKSLPADDQLLPKLNESIMQCLVAKRDYDQALPYAQRLLQLERNRQNSGTLADTSDFIWAALENLDLLRRLGTKYDAERLALRGKLAPLIEQFLTLRSDLESSGALPTLDELKKEFLSQYVRQNHPTTVAEYLWLTSDFQMRTLPLIGWFPQETPKATLLCIHGLGLENRSFTPFGLDMAKKGFAVFAMDVRGFGSWLTLPGEEDVQFDYALSDIGGILAFLKERNPSAPIFLVGESMGGGIALQAGARYSKELAGIIASVPSPDRFQEGRATMSVALHFLKGRNKRFDIGTMVAQKATSNPTVLRAWETDPKAKLDMTPKELMRFDKFMRETKQQCAAITNTPVFIVQGGKDRLVKPQGSQDLYNAVGSEDKSLLIAGDAEHLIFETERPSPVLLDSLSAWMINHARPY
ncbi:MAG TPA: alpha/beta fold hydrolase [Candidatus Obscuribacterales bacterium]